MSEHGYSVRIVISDHTRLRMTQRRISEIQVRQTVLEPDRIEDAEDGCKRAVRGTVSSNSIHVIYEDKGSVIVVVTVYQRDK